MHTDSNPEWDAFLAEHPELGSLKALTASRSRWAATDRQIIAAVKRAISEEASRAKFSDHLIPTQGAQVWGIARVLFSMDAETWKASYPSILPWLSHRLLKIVEAGRLRRSCDTRLDGWVYYVPAKPRPDSLAERLRQVAAVDESQVRAQALGRLADSLELFELQAARQLAALG